MKLTDQAYIQINQALFSITHAYEARLAGENPRNPRGLTVYDCAVLMVLGQFAPVKSHVLAESMQVSRSTISVYICRLCRKRLVRMEQAAEDRRHWWLRLTPQGKKAYAEILKGTVAYTRDFISVLNDEQQRTLHQLLLQVSHSLGFKWQ